MTEQHDPAKTPVPPPHFELRAQAQAQGGRSPGVEAEPEAARPNVTAYQLQELSGELVETAPATLDPSAEVELDVTIELGRALMYLEDVLNLRRGSVVPLEKLAGEPVDVYVSGRLVARGEVLVLNDNFSVRVTERIGPCPG